MNLKFQGNQVTYFFKLNQKYFFLQCFSGAFLRPQLQFSKLLVEPPHHLVHILKQFLILDKLKMLWYIHVQISAVIYELLMSC